jgi:hypothetical protein
MAFVNEFISLEDVEKYGIKAIDRRFLKVTFEPDWTIDRERNVYLRFVGSGREEFADHKDCTLYWRGSLLLAQLEQKISISPDGEKSRHYTLLQLDLPEEYESLQAEIILALKEALIVYQGGGVYSSQKQCATSFDF